ncbi:MAG: NlpC/P60 family protein [Clostridium sp.]|nr:NlpC/P60 family protein [Clostridium sp.]
MKKRILSLMLSALVLTGVGGVTISLPQLTTTVAAATNVQPFSKTGTVTTSSGNLNVRKDATTSSKIIGKLPNGSSVTITGKTSDGKWYRIKYNSTVGYVSAAYVTLNSTPSPISQTRQAIIKRAQDMVDMTWKTPKEFTGWKRQKVFKTNTTYTGMPYSQTPNQMTSPTNFTNSIQNYSGSLTLTSPQTQPRFGNDCSGFVSAAWGISRHTTSTLPNVSTEISYSNLQPGDILNLAGSHTFMFKGWSNASKTEMVVLEQTPPSAVQTIKSVAKCKTNGYKARRLNGLK